MKRKPQKFKIVLGVTYTITCDKAGDVDYLIREAKRIAGDKFIHSPTYTVMPKKRVTLLRAEKLK